MLFFKKGLTERILIHLPMAGLSPSDSHGLTLQDRGSAVPVRQSRDETGMHVCVCGGGEVEVFEDVVQPWNYSVFIQM